MPKEIEMDSILDVFANREFGKYDSIIGQRCTLNSDSYGRNKKWLKEGKTGYWPSFERDDRQPELIVVRLDSQIDRQIVEIWAGVYDHQEEGTKGYFVAFSKKPFRLVGVHNKARISDREFMKGGVGSSRFVLSRRAVTAAQQTHTNASATVAAVASQLETLSPTNQSEILREVWMRGSAHDRFKRKLKKLWNDQCSVHGGAANGLLVASHIWAWSDCVPERENQLNGLLLSVPLDKLFDRHLISFDDDGKILISEELKAETRLIFAVREGMQLRWSDIDEQHWAGICKFLVIHRERYAEKLKKYRADPQ